MHIFLVNVEESNLKRKLKLFYLNRHPLLLSRLQHCIQNSNISGAFKKRKARLNLVATILLQRKEMNYDVSKPKQTHDCISCVVLKMVNISCKRRLFISNELARNFYTDFYQAIRTKKFLQRTRKRTAVSITSPLALPVRYPTKKF